MAAPKRTLLVVVVAAMVATACAGIMGIEAAVLDPSAPDGGMPPTGDASTTEDGGVLPGTESDACVGAGCPCTKSEECRDPTAPHCAKGVCGECVTTPTDSCAIGYCLEGSADAGVSYNQCATGCSTNEACAKLSPTAPYCALERHQCVACLEKAHCGPGQDCSPSGVCADTCVADGGTCDDVTKKCCAGFCVDPTTDVLNCTACGNDCTAALQNASGVTCSAGACVYASCLQTWANCDGNTSNGCECSCGGEDEPCCPSTTGGASTCQAGLKCINNVCQACGLLGQRCCSTSPACPGSNVECRNSSCVSCKGKNAQCTGDWQCCAPYDCNSGKCTEN